MTFEDMYSLSMNFKCLSKLALVLLSFFAFLNFAKSEDVLRLSMSDALELTAQRHVDVLVANERVQQAISRIAQAKSPLLPKLDGSVSMYRETVNLKSFGINFNVPGFNPLVPPFNVFDARISLQQTLFDLAVLRRLKASRYSQTLSLAEKQKAEEDAMALVANLYLEAQRAEESYQLIQVLQKRDEARLRNAVNQKTLGLGSAIEVTQAESNFAQTKNQVAQAKAAKEERRLDLVAALGLDENQKIQFVSHESFLKKALPTDDILRSQVANHPDIEVAKKQLDVDTENKKAQVAAYYPKLSANANYGANGPHPGDVDDTYVYGGALSVPLYQGGLRKAQVQEAASKIHESTIQLDQTQKDKISQAYSALEVLKQAQVGVKAAQADLNKSSQEFSLAQQKKSIGVGTDIQVIEYEAQYANSKDIQSEAIATYRLAWVNLVHSMGGMRQWAREEKK